MATCYSKKEKGGKKAVLNNKKTSYKRHIFTVIKYPTVQEFFRGTGVPVDSFQGAPHLCLKNVILSLQLYQLHLALVIYPKIQYCT